LEIPDEGEFLCEQAAIIPDHKKKTGSHDATRSLKKGNRVVSRKPREGYLVFEGQGFWQHCLWQHAPRLRVAAASATIAAILVMVMIKFASFVSWLPDLTT
jgi:hypothetical protein